MQARAKYFACSFSSYTFWTICLTISFGTPAARAIARFARVTAVAVAISAALELRARKAFLRLLAACGKGATGPELSGLTAGGSSKKHV